MFKITELEQEKITIIEAGNTITQDDYLAVLRPFLDKAKEEGKKIKILFHTNNDFKGYTFGAALEDAKLGIHHFHTFAKCAIVSDVAWIINSCKFFSSLIPCPIKTFAGKDLEEAKKWLATDHVSLSCELDQSSGVAVIEIKDSLSAEDFKIISQTIDPWISSNGELKGLAIHAKKFPYWENFDGLISHISFVKNHHRKVKRVAIIADGALPNLAPKLAKHFVKAEIKHFDYPDLQQGLAWIKSAN